MLPLSRGRADDIAQKQNTVAELYETHFERVARYIAVRIGNFDEAEEMASEVFVRALRSIDSYKDTGAPMEAWIYRIAHNIVVDHLRKKGRRPASVPIDEALHVSSGSGNPEDNLRRQEEVTQLHRAIETLSPAQRQVLALRFGSEMSSEQVGQIMGKKSGAVREMQSAAIKKLREVLDGE